MRHSANFIACLIFTTLITPTWSDEPGNSSKESPATSGQDEETRTTPPLTPEAEQAVVELRASHPADSEPLAMLDAILNGSRLGPGEGWFKHAVSRSHYTWDVVSRKYDADTDGAISAEEFGGSETDFARLDRNGNKSLAEDDLDLSGNSLYPSPGFMLFFMADADANGKVTPEEFSSLFSRFDTDGRGYLALDDLRDELLPPDPGQRHRRPDAPSRSTLILGLQRQEIGSLQPGPALEELAPDFTLHTVDDREVTLSKEVGEKPIVLIFGNFTCGPFRSQSGNIEKLYQRYKDRAKFFLVYVREAHPADGWWMTSNQRVGIDLTQPTTNAERRAVAATCRSHLGLDDSDLPFLVDTVDDKVGAAYSGMPNRLYLINTEGRVMFKSGRGPFGFKPREMEQVLIMLLLELQPPTSP